MKVAKVFLGFIVIAIFTLFATANLESVPIHFLTKNQPLLGHVKSDDPGASPVAKEIPVFIVIYISFGAGFVVAWFLSSQLIRTHKKTLKKLQKQYDVMSKERDDLRNLPLHPADNADVPKTGDSDRVKNGAKTKP